MDPSIPRILDFWFDAPHLANPLLWFQPDPALDQRIKDQFSDLISQARTPTLDCWTETPQGTLAMLILLDQFSRNVFRGSPDSWSSDAKALNISAAAIAKEFDTQVAPMQQCFFYTPFMHAETLLGQIASVALYEGLVQRCKLDSPAKASAARNLRFAKSHRDVIAMFGRFPSRNGVLGRKSTEEEKKFLEQHPSGF